MTPSSVTIESLLIKITTEILNPLIVLLFGIGIVVFIWGVILYVLGGQGDETKLQQGRRIMIWGIIGLFIMASAWGIVQLLCDFFETCGAGGGIPGGNTSSSQQNFNIPWP